MMKSKSFSFIMHIIILYFINYKHFIIMYSIDKYLYSRYLRMIILI